MKTTNPMLNAEMSMRAYEMTFECEADLLEGPHIIATFNADLHEWWSASYLFDSKLEHYTGLSAYLLLFERDENAKMLVLMNNCYVNNDEGERTHGYTCYVLIKDPSEPTGYTQELFVRRLNMVEGPDGAVVTSTPMPTDGDAPQGRIQMLVDRVMTEGGDLMGTILMGDEDATEGQLRQVLVNIADQALSVHFDGVPAFIEGLEEPTS